MFITVSMFTLIATLAITLHSTPTSVKAQNKESWIAVSPTEQTFYFKNFFDPLDTSEPYKGDKVKVSVDINVTDLYSFEYKLKWNSTSWLNVTHCTIFSPWGEGNYSVYANEITDLGNGYSQHYLGVEANETAGALPFNGTTTVCRYTFNLEHYPFYPLPNVTSTFDLTDTMFLNLLSEPIDHDPRNGECKFLREKKVPLVEVDSINWTLPVGSNCTVDVRISNVTANPPYADRMFGIRGVCVALLYDTEHLDCLKIEPNRDAPKTPSDHFMEPTDPDKIFFAEVSIINDYFDNGTYGRAKLCFTLLDPEEPRTGGGVLARFTFNITKEGTGKPLRFYEPGVPFPLHLTYVDLKSQKPGVVPCTLAEVTIGPGGPEAPFTLPIEYIVAVVIIAVIVGSVALHYVRKRRD